LPEFPSEVLKTDEEEPAAMADNVSMALAEPEREAEAVTASLPID
jgi:hypothetical protein